MIYGLLQATQTLKEWLKSSPAQLVCVCVVCEWVDGWLGECMAFAMTTTFFYPFALKSTKVAFIQSGLVNR